MLDLILAIVIAIITPGQADALRSTAPQYLDLESAREHLGAAIVAAAVTNTDPSMLLSIAHHESNYKHREVNGAEMSCGVMTPEPGMSRRACSAATSSVLAGYLAGAAHLRVWFDACGGRQRCALIGYAGGWKALGRCAREGVVWIRPGVDGCKTDAVFEWRAHWIRSSLRKSRGGGGSS